MPTVTGKTRGRADSANQSRFERLFVEHRSAVLGYALRRTKASEDAAEILSDTFLVAWRRFEELPGDDLARAWLLGVARNLLLNQDRGAMRGEVLNRKLKHEVAALPTPGPAEPTEADHEVSEALERLSEDDRELLTLSAWDDLTPNEIAETLGAKRATVRSQLHRARQRLKAELEVGRS